VIGYLYAGVPEASGAIQAEAFVRGLSEVGFVEGRDVAIEYRWARNDRARLSELAADLVRRRVAVIVTPGSAAAARAAKEATTTIPVVFSSGGDPVQFGLVTNFNRPGGNVTGFTSLGVHLGPKRIGFLHELLPKAARLAVLDNPASASAGSFASEVQEAGAAIGLHVQAHLVSTDREIDTAFASLAQNPVDGLIVAPGPLFGNRRVQLVTLAAFHHLPAVYSGREMVEIGGLMSYGSSVSDAARQTGIYAGRILKGEKAGELPVQQATRFEFIINLQTAKTFGLTVPETLLATADEVIQ
jgi:putative ABC transport system substrate-binding protein